MAAPLLNNVYQLRIFCYDADMIQVGINTLYFRVTNVAGVGTMSEQSMTQGLSNLWKPRYIDSISQGANYYGVQARLVFPVPPIPVAPWHFSDTTAGTIAFDPLPLQVTAIITLKTGFSGPHWRGRIYIPFLPNSFSNADGGMTDAARATLQANIGQFIPAIETITQGGNSIVVEYCLRSAVENPLDPDNPVIYHTKITAAAAVGRFATQRRRGQFGRINAMPF